MKKPFVMSEIARWFDRQFTSRHPPELHPNLRCRLAGTAPRMEEEFRGLSEAAASQRFADTWSVKRNAVHLHLLEPLWDLRLDDFLAGREVLSPADLTNRATEESLADDLSLEEIAANFRRSRAAALERLDGLQLTDFARSALHPRLKTPMTLVDLMAFVAEHDDHHLARIRELKRLLGA